MKIVLWSSKKTAAFLYPELEVDAGLNALRVLTWRKTLLWREKKGREVYYLAYDVRLYARLRRNRLAKIAKRASVL